MANVVVDELPPRLGERLGSAEFGARFAAWKVPVPKRISAGGDG